MSANEVTVTRGGQDIVGTYNAVTIYVDDSDRLVVNVGYTDNMGQRKGVPMDVVFAGATADQLRAQIIAGVDARIKSEYGD